MQRDTREYDGGHTGELSEQVAHGVGLAGTRGPVEQQAALEVLAGGMEPLAQRSDLEHLALDRRALPRGG